MTIDTMPVRICGIPAQVKYAIYPPSYGKREGGLPIEPDEPASVEIIDILDRHGYPAPWLERKMSRTIHDNLKEDILRSMT